MNYIEKQLLLSSAVKAIDFLGSISTTPKEPSTRFKFEEEDLSATGADPMQTLDLLHQQGGHAHDYFENALCMPETVTPALATNWLISSWNLKLRSQVLNNREVLVNIRTAVERWLRQLLPVDEAATFYFHADQLSANFRALVIARDALLHEMNWETSVRGIFHAPSISVVASAALSERAMAALSLAGFGKHNITFAPTNADGTLDLDRLPRLHERSILYLQAMHPITGAIENGAVIQMARAEVPGFMSMHP